MASHFTPSGSQSSYNGLKVLFNLPPQSPLSLFHLIAVSPLSPKKREMQVSSLCLKYNKKPLTSGPLQLFFHLTRTPFPQITAWFVLLLPSCLWLNVTLSKHHPLTILYKIQKYSTQHLLLTLCPVLFLPTALAHYMVYRYLLFMSFYWM